jgi:hypothetical protein
MPTPPVMIPFGTVLSDTDKVGDYARRVRLRPRTQFITALSILAALATLGVAACTGINLDPISHREFPRANAAETAPPPELANGSAQ